MPLLLLTYCSRTYNSTPSTLTSDSNLDSATSWRLEARQGSRHPGAVSEHVFLQPQDCLPGLWKSLPGKDMAAGHHCSSATVHKYINFFFT